MSVAARPALGAALAAALLALAVGCDTRVLTGQFLCDVGVPDTCPPGWLCQVRAPGTEPRCYATAGDFCGDLKRTGDEACDGDDFGDDSCAARGFPRGALRCSGCRPSRRRKRG